MKKIIRYILVAMCAAMPLVLASCGGDDEPSGGGGGGGVIPNVKPVNRADLIGAWKRDEGKLTESLVMKDDGTFRRVTKEEETETIAEGKFEYRSDTKQLVLSPQDPETLIVVQEVYTVSFADDTMSMILTDRWGKSIVYQRQGGFDPGTDWT